MEYKCRIYKKEKVIGIEGTSFNEKELAVEGKDMKEVVKIFEENWK